MLVVPLETGAPQCWVRNNGVQSQHFGHVSRCCVVSRCRSSATHHAVMRENVNVAHEILGRRGVVVGPRLGLGDRLSSGDRNERVQHKRERVATGQRFHEIKKSTSGFAQPQRDKEGVTDPSPSRSCTA